MKKCKKCFLTPDMCGAENDKQKCERIYDYKWSMRVEMLIKLAKSTILIAFLLMFLVLSGIATYWKLR